MKNYILLAIIILSNLVSCSQALNTSETFSLFALLNYRQNVTIGGTFFGNYNADVRTVALSTDGKCDTTQAGLGSGSTDDSGGFKVSYPRISSSGGYVCVIASPRADGTSRFFAVDQQKEFAWTGSAYSVLVLPEPSTTSRSQFNVVSTMFNRMATQKLEKLAEGNKDLSRAGTLLKSANKQIVSQFGLSRGLSKNISSTRLTLKETLNRILYSEPRASSLETATPDLNDIVIDFSKKDDPITLKFTVIIGGIQSLADPNDPSSYDKVVGLISNVIASGNSSSEIVFPGGATLSAGGSFGALVSSKIQTFVQSQGAALGLSETEINNIKTEAVQLATAIDKPPLSATPIVTVAPVVEKPLYSLATNTYKIGESFSISPQITGVTNLVITDVCTTYCQSISNLSIPSTSLTLPSSLSTGSSLPPFPSNGNGLSFSTRSSLPTLQGNGNGLTISTGSSLTLSTNVNNNSSVLPGNLPPWLQFSGTTGVITGTVPEDLPGDISFQLRISGIRYGTTVTGTVNFTLRGKPTLFFFSQGSYLTINGLQQISIGPLPQNLEISYTPTIVGANSILSISGLPAGGCIAFNNSSGTISGNFSCITTQTAAELTIYNDVGSNIYSINFIPNSKPTVSSLSISGTLFYPNTVFANYIYIDNNYNPELGSTFAWYLCPTALGKCSTISGANSKSYTIQASDVGKYLMFQVTPKDSLGLAGDAVLSTAVLVENRAPSIASVSITNVGNIYAGDTLNSSTSGYSDPENNPPGTFVYNWYRCTAQSSCDTTPSGTSSTYVTSTSDGGKLIKLQVSPVDNLGAVGTPVIASQFVSIIQAPAQCLSYTSKSGSDRHIGLMGTGSSCDNTTNGSWVRFDSIYSIIPNAIVASSSCGTDATGYLTTDHPITLFQQVSGTVCYNWSGNSCNWANQISITKCNGYYVYQLPNTPACSLRYCTTAISISNPSYNSVGSTLQGSYGELFTSQNIPQYNWLRCDSSAGSNCVTISGATTSSYTITSNDIGKFLQFQVTPVNGAPVKSQIVQVFNPNQDLVLYMPFNGNFNDESSSPMPQYRYDNANTAQPVLTIDRRNNPSSNAYSSNRTNYLVMTSADKITSLATNYTMSAWINLDAGISDHGIFSTWNNSSGMIFRVYNYQVQNQNFTCPTTITPGQWVHVVGVSEGTTAKIYFNGNLCRSGENGSITALPSDYANKWLLVGSDYYPSGYTRTLKGKMDDLRIYNRVLSASEVLSLYNYEK